MKDRKKFYEHFQVEDVLAFSLGSLLLARSPAGEQVLLHEINKMRSLPSDYKDILTKLNHPHLVPSREIYDDGEYVVIVYPVLFGDPLTLLVTPEKPLDSAKALNLYRQLLQSVKELSELPVPIVTTLDPRNIVMAGDHPYLLFFDIGERGPQREDDEAWRGLLYYLVTGIRSKYKPYPSLSEIKLDPDLPDSIQLLIQESLNPRRTLTDIIQLAQNTALPLHRKKKDSFKLHSVTIPAAVSAAILSILFMGYFVMYTDALNMGNHSVRTPDQTAGESVRVVEQIPSIRFNGSEVTSHLAKQPVSGITHIQFHIIQNKLGPFSASFLSEETSQQYGIRLDSIGELSVVGEQYKQEQNFAQPSVRNSKSFWLNSKHSYQVDLYYIPNERLRISVKDLYEKTEWMTVGPLMKDENYRFRFRGNERTTVSQVSISRFHDSQTALEKWMNGHQWDLAHGEVLADQKGIRVQPKSQLQISKFGFFSFQFFYPEKIPTDPVQLDLETAEGNQLKFIWRKNRNIELNHIDDQLKLTTKKILWDWDPKIPAKVNVHNQDTMVKIEIEQKNKSESLIYYFDRPVLIKKGIVPIEEEMDIKILPVGNGFEG
ncbi:hypothetical protein [Lihuaxuella thermophila]|uniref:Uncharacterized protein n=1 Tax=Lihuaxuella thermophila TaxID=1173111 RepID=A0A1H8EXC6_9BACL|nr:hypothetical protein [Lihuaxuella thermophila]SEN24050.1 hypothetical protein SAMN05444955_107218 [Lihuaxuella thermophila]